MFSLSNFNFSNFLVTIKIAVFKPKTPACHHLCAFLLLKLFVLTKIYCHEKTVLAKVAICITQH